MKSELQHIGRHAGTVLAGQLAVMAFGTTDTIVASRYSDDALAAFAGNVVGYEIGRKLGAPLYERQGRFINKANFDKTHAFFVRYGAKALVLGRFVPIVRTFVTVVAGVGKMERRHFFVWSGVGAVLWAVGVTLAGYFLGQAFPVLSEHLEAAILLIVAVSVVPMILEFLKHRREARRVTAS